MKIYASRLLYSQSICVFTFSLLILLLSPAALLAQDLDHATISGQLTDQQGAVIRGATVTLVRASNAFERSVTSDAQGRYRLIELEPDAYTVRISAQNFATEERVNLILIAGQNAQLDFTLYPARLAVEQIVVSETDAPLVDATRTIVGGTITRDEVESLPVATRSPLDLVFTIGGVTEEPLSTRDLAEDRNQNPPATPEEAGIFALSGGSAFSNNITIDGLDNNDDRAARERFQPSLEAIDEVQIIRNQFSAEYGRASGGRVNLRTRSGAKNLRGRFFYFFRDESLNANTFFNNLRGLKRLPLQEHNPGFTLSGPLFLPRFGEGDSSLYNGRRRTFFFTSYEYTTLLDTSLINTFVPVQQGAYKLPPPTLLDERRTENATGLALRTDVAPFISSISTPLRNHTFTTKVDHQFTNAHNGTFLYQRGRLKNLRQFGGGNRLAEALQGRTRNTDAFAYSDNYVFSSNVVNQLRLQFSRLRPAFAAESSANPVLLINIAIPQEGSNRSDSRTLIAGSSTSGATDRREDRFQIQDTLSLLRGAHSLKFGGDIMRIRSTFIDLADVSGTYNFASAGDFLAGAATRFRQNFQTASTQRNTYTGFFLQDEWRVRRNLTLSYGLRYENETIIRDRNNFSPRLALAYDPFSSGKTVIRFGAGIFYNRALLRTIDDFTLGKQRLLFDTHAIFPTDATGAQRRAFIAANLQFPNALSLDSPLIKEYGTVATNFSRRLDPTLRIPESYQFNIGAEREIARSFVVEANYTFNRGLHLFREFNVNAPVLPRGFKDFSEYLLSRDFTNFRSAAGTRPLYNSAGAGELVRFAAAPLTMPNPDRILDFGIPISVFNLNSVNSTNALNAALGALQNLRPDPTRTELEQLASIGNSFYHGLTVEARRRFSRRKGFNYSLRAAYTLSRLIDDGIINTSDALVPGDFRRERSRSLLDRRHRFTLSGTFNTPRYLGKLQFAPILRVASGAPFNISIGGEDRNLDDVGNDRPNFTGDLSLLRARRSGDPLDPALLKAFNAPIIGQSGNLPRNAGVGPGLFVFDLNLTREFRFSDGKRLRPVIEFDNVLNKTVFSFGTEFVNFDALSPTATEKQRQDFMSNFLVTTRTLRPRMIRLGLRLDF